MLCDGLIVPSHLFPSYTLAAGGASVPVPDPIAVAPTVPTPVAPTTPAPISEPKAGAVFIGCFADLRADRMMENVSEDPEMTTEVSVGRSRVIGVPDGVGLAFRASVSTDTVHVLSYKSRIGVLPRYPCISSRGNFR